MALSKRKTIKIGDHWFNPKLIIGISILLLLASLQFIGPLIYNSELAYMGSSPTNVVHLWVEADESLGFKPADPAHPLGTETRGRDILAILLVGTPRTLGVGFVAAGIGIFVGIILGFTSGFLGKWVDSIISTMSDVMMVIPGLAVLVVIASYVTELEFQYMALILAIFAWPMPTRTIRSQVLSMKQRGYVQVARISGVPTISIIFKEILPNLLPFLASSLTASISTVILTLTALETLGLGPARIPTLGMTINYALRSSAVIRGMWWWWGFPIIILVLIFLSLFLMTVGLDEIANPRLRKQ